MWTFKKKEQPIYVLVRDYEGRYHMYIDSPEIDINSDYLETYRIIEKSEDKSLITGLFVSLSQQAELAEEIKKHITDSMLKGDTDIITSGGRTFISESTINNTIPTTEDIKNMIEDPNILYAVQGNYPNITISKYEKVAEDSLNYCLRQKEGSMVLLPKTICFNSKADAIIYQNKLIQQSSQDKSKKK